MSMPGTPSPNPAAIAVIPGIAGGPPVPAKPSQTVTTGPEDIARRLHGISSFERGDFAEALQALYPLLKKSPNDPDLLAYYGMALEAAGRHADGVKILSRIAGTPQTPAQVQIALANAERALAGGASVAPQTPSPSAPLPLAPGPPAQYPPAQYPPAQHPSGQYPPSAQYPPPAPAAPVGSPPRSLADDLDKPLSDIPSAAMRGERQFVWHRRLTSYRRLWLGVLLVVAAIVASAVGLPHSLGSNVTNSNLDLEAQINVGLDAVVVLGLLLLVFAVVSGRFTSYTVYEHRIDIKRGVFSQRSEPVWLYDISGLDMRRTPLMTLTGTASIEIELDGKAASPQKQRIVASGRANAMRSYLEKLQGDVVRERRAMKKMWI